MQHSLKYLLCFLSGVVLATSVSLSGSEQTYDSTNAFHKEYDYSLLLDIIDTVETYYVEDVDRESLIQAAINGVFEHLDPYSDFLNQAEFESLTSTNKGEYYGFGFEVATDNDQITIVTPFKNSPADKAGLMPGDVITHLDNTAVDGSNLSDILKAIKQHSMLKQGIHLTIAPKASEQSQQITLTPDYIHIESIDAKIIDDVGYIYIANFQEDAAKAILKQAIAWQNRNLKGLILDVRNNPGGLLDQAIEIADLFLDKGRIVSTQGRFFDANEDYYASNHTIFTQLPMVVLINQGSASASEVLAAALQENNRAHLVGESSFGKGTVQSLIPMVGQGNAIKLTIAKYNTPKGNDIHEIGIQPDTKITLPTVAEQDNVHIINNTNMQSTSIDAQIDSAIAWISKHG
ncbi:S41 family peptidase [Shewanella maritima]|uniref:S41 family peptidase n=1 Tax=Shewanella maritima TaxID=2520507 RepID=UPI003735F12F